MLTFPMLMWIGVQMNAPVWYMVLAWIGIASTVINMLVQVYKAGKKDSE